MSYNFGTYSDGSILDEGMVVQIFLIVVLT